jgi:hypothetical protein
MHATAQPPSRSRECGEAGERHRHHRQHQAEQRRQQHPAVHEVAAHAGDIQREERRPQHEHGDHRDSGEAGPSGHLHPGAPAPAQQCEHPDEQDRHRDPQQVRRHQVEQVVPALPPAGRARLLGQRGGGHQQAVVAGPEHLIGQRHRSGHHCEADQAEPPPTGLQDYQRDGHEQPEERQVGADERGEAEDERDRPRPSHRTRSCHPVV